MEENNEKVQYMLDDFDALMQQKDERQEEVTADELDRIAAKIDNTTMLQQSLPAMLKKAEEYKEKVESCDRQVKSWQDSKKLWKRHQEAFMDMLEKIVGNLKLPGNSIKNGSIKLAVSSRTAIEVDEEWLLGQFENMRVALQSQLPDYIKVSYTVDKNKLSAFLKTDKTMLTEHPEKIHSKLTTSCTIKG